MNNHKIPIIFRWGKSNNIKEQESRPEKEIEVYNHDKNVLTDEESDKYHSDVAYQNIINCVEYSKHKKDQRLNG